MTGQTASANLHRLNSTPNSSSLPVVPAAPKVATLLHVTDSETGQPLANSQVQVAYFGAGGEGEGHDLVTDSNGTAAIPKPDDPTKSQAGNVFVVAEGHVPEAIGFQSTMPADYSLKLDPAMAASGIIEDEQGQPVPGVKILVQDPGDEPGQMVNVDFQTCPVTNHDDGTWSCSYIPFNYTNEIRFILRKNGYAATYPIVPVNRTGLANLVLVINRGHTIIGRVIGAQDEPVAGASIKVVTSEPGKDQRAKTDNDGSYTLNGVAGDFGLSQEPPIGTNDNGAFIVQGLAGNGSLHVDLAIQADGFAPQTATVALSSPTNKTDFLLSPGNIFRGHLTDESGHPIPNAMVQTDWNNQGVRAFDWHTRTDVDGGFEWDFAPTGTVLYWFEADGYQVQRFIPLVADESDHRITLKSNSPQ
jgi:uncharacterized GH25 family protein